MSSSVRVSVVVPVYNAAPFLRAFLDSFLNQDLPTEEFELIAVDDGSTDDSRSILDESASEHENITVIHQANSGWPGKPRNVGLAAARGDYVFFADPDDEFGGPEALRKLVEFADENSSDVVVPKMVPKGNRTYAQWRYRTTQIDADLVTCFTTLTPQKLFRRSFLMAEEIRFPEEKVRLEDGQFLSQAYLLADRVSILTGYDFYYLIHHPEQRHLSSRAIDPENYIGSVAEMSKNVERLCDDDDTADRIINEIYFRKVLANFTRSRVTGHSPDLQQAWLENQQNFADRFITDARYAKMDEVARVRTDLVRAGDLDAIVTYASAGKVDFLFESASSSQGAIELKGALSSPLDDARLVITERGSAGKEIDLPLISDGAGAVVTVPKSVLRRSDATRRFDLWLSPGLGQPNRRIAGPASPFSQHFTDDRDVELYTTVKGNLSVAVRKGMTVTGRVKRRLKRLFGP